MHKILVCAALSLLSYGKVTLPSQEKPFLPSQFDTKSSTPLTDFVMAAITRFEPEEYIRDRFCSKESTDNRASYPGGSAYGLVHRGTIKPNKLKDAVDIGVKISVVGPNGDAFAERIGHHHSEIEVIQRDEFTTCYRTSFERAGTEIEYHCTSGIPTKVFLAKVQEIIKQNQEKKAADATTKSESAVK